MFTHLLAAALILATFSAFVAALYALFYAPLPNKPYLSYKATIKGNVMLKQPFAYVNRKGNTYYLHTTLATLKNGREQRIYFFKKDCVGALTEVPTGFAVDESKTGLPVLKKLREPVAA